ncbi:MAG: hypothetical protein WC980_00475 [Candidatus Brocadiia bacterium]
MKNRSKIIALGLVATIALSFSSCTLMKKYFNTGSQGLVQSPAIKSYQAPDVPVPSNFIHMPEESLTFINGTVRTSYLKYVGSARTNDVINFYASQMETNGWTRIQTGNRESMVYQKKKEICKIEIVQLISETQLIVRIGYYKTELPDPFKK